MEKQDSFAVRNKLFEPDSSKSKQHPIRKLNKGLVSFSMATLQNQKFAEFEENFAKKKFERYMENSNKMAKKIIQFKKK